MNKIQLALEAYIHTNKKLPCPASLTDIPTSPTYGVAQTNNLNLCNSSAGTLGYAPSSNTTADTMRYGAVPVRTLGLSIEYLGDGFGNKFSYIVPAATTTPSAIFKTLNTAPNNGFKGSNFGTLGNCTNDVVCIKQTTSGNISINGRSVYAVISHGPNGFGAVNINATTQNSVSGAGSDEIENYYVAAYDNSFTYNSGNSPFDDIIIYDDRENIITKIGTLP